MQEISLTSLPFQALCRIASFLGTVPFHLPTTRLSFNHNYGPFRWITQLPFNSDLLAFAKASPLLAHAVVQQLRFNPWKNDVNEAEPTNHTSQSLYLCPDLMLTTSRDWSARPSIWKFWLSVMSQNVTRIALQEALSDGETNLSDLYKTPWRRPAALCYHVDDGVKLNEKVTKSHAFAFVKEISVRDLPALRDLDLVVRISPEPMSFYEYFYCYRSEERASLDKLEMRFVAAVTVLLASIGPQLYRLRLPADDGLTTSLKNCQKNKRPILFPRLQMLSIIRDEQYHGSYSSYTDLVCTVVHSIKTENCQNGGTPDLWCSPLKTLSLSNVPHHALTNLPTIRSLTHIFRSVTSLSLSVSECTETDTRNRHNDSCSRNVAQFVGAFFALRTFQWTGPPNRNLIKRILRGASSSLCDISIISLFKKPQPSIDSTDDPYDSDEEEEISEGIIEEQSASHNSKLSSMVLQAGEKLTSLTAVSSTTCRNWKATSPLLGIKCLEIGSALSRACHGLRELDIEINNSTVTGLARLIQCNDDLRLLVLRIRVSSDGVPYKLLASDKWDTLGHSITTHRRLHTVDISSFEWDYQWDYEIDRQRISREELSKIVSFIKTVLREVESPLRDFRFLTRVPLTRSFQELLELMEDIISIFLITGRSREFLLDLFVRFENDLCAVQYPTISWLENVQDILKAMESKIRGGFQNAERVQLGMELGLLRELVNGKIQEVEDEEYVVNIWNNIHDEN